MNVPTYAIIGAAMEVHRLPYSHRFSKSLID